MIQRLSLAAGAILGLFAGGSWLWQSNSEKSAAPASAPAPAAASAAIAVEVVRVQPEPLEVQVTATGTLLGREAVQIVSELSRRLVKVHAEEGAQVARGDVLFELDSTDLAADLAKLDVQSRLARATLDRTERLSAEGLSNQQELDLARARVDEVEADRRALRVTLGKTLIRAPFPGALGLRRVSEGAWLTPSTLLSTLQDTSSLKLDFTLPERYAGALRPGSSFRFRVEGRPESYTGQVAAVEPSVDPATRSLLVRGVIEGAPGLYPGSAASVEVPLRVEQALLVPSIAVVPGIEGRRVFVADAGRARAAKVELGFRSADRVQVLSGLAAGDAVITTNLLRLREDAAVTLQSEAAVR
ncbi:MAG TPA: efflux RND transporter periplasmic adaptor subunit [Polyangiaceae bacterium]|nr:efflux RND transporter periplasmic adaptor subunit [Polyangiaceae bacterium]